MCVHSVGGTAPRLKSQRVSAPGGMTLNYNFHEPCSSLKYESSRSNTYLAPDCWRSNKTMGFEGPRMSLPGISAAQAWKDYVGLSSTLKGHVHSLASFWDLPGAAKPKLRPSNYLKQPSTSSFGPRCLLGNQVKSVDFLPGKHKDTDSRPQNMHTPQGLMPPGSPPWA